MKKCIALVSDQNYIEHVKYLFSSIKFKGNWQGDLCLVANNINPNILHEFKSKGIHIFKINKKTDSYVAKYYLFNKNFKKWDIVCYFDVDFVILNDINGLINSNGLLADVDGNPKKQFTIGEMLDNSSDVDTYNEISKIYNLNQVGFNSGCMVYNTDIIKEDTLDDLIKLSKRCKTINHHTGPEGTDQPILNLYFQNQWKQINGVSFHRNRRGNEVAIHTCRWEAPWKDERYIGQYNYYLNKWKDF